MGVTPFSRIELVMFAQLQGWNKGRFLHNKRRSFRPEHELSSLVFSF